MFYMMLLWLLPAPGVLRQGRRGMGHGWRGMKCTTLHMRSVWRCGWHTCGRRSWNRGNPADLWSSLDGGHICGGELAITERGKRKYYIRECRPILIGLAFVRLRKWLKRSKLLSLLLLIALFQF